MGTDLAAPLMSSGLMSGTQQSEFSSADGTFRVIYVESAQPFRTYKDNIAWTTEIKRLAADWNRDHGLKLQADYCYQFGPVRGGERHEVRAQVQASF